MTESARFSGNDTKRAARNVSALIIASIVSKGLLFAWQLILVPWLGDFDYGVYGTVGALMAVAASISSFSMGLIVIRDVARAPTQAGKYWSAMMVWQTALALLAYVGMNGFAVGYSEAVRVFAALAGINLFVDLFGNMGHDLLLAREAMLKTSSVEVGHIILRIGLAVLALSLGWGLLGVYGAAIASGLVRSAALVGLNWRAGLRPQFPFDRRIGMPLLVNSAPLALSAFLTQVYQHTDKLMTTGILGEASAGHLTVAFVIHFGIIELFSTTVLVAAYPMLSRYYESGKNPLFGLMIEKLSLYMVIITLPLALTISIFADDIIAPLFGLDFAPTAGILRLLIWYTMLAMIGNVFSKAMLIQNRQRRLLLFRAVGLLLNIALNTILLFGWGDPRGAALASIMAETLALGLLVWNFRTVGWQWRKIAASIRRLLAFAALAALVMLTLRGLHFMLAMALGLGIYIGAVLYGRVLSENDWDLLYRLASAMPGGAAVRRCWKRDVEWGG